MEELLSSRESEEVSLLYGPLLCQWLALIRVQLLLALCERVPHLPEPLGPTAAQDGDATQPSQTEDGQRSLFGGPQKLTPGRLKVR